MVSLFDRNISYKKKYVEIKCDCNRDGNGSLLFNKYIKMVVKTLKKDRFILHTKKNYFFLIKVWFISHVYMILIFWSVAFWKPFNIFESNKIIRSIEWFYALNLVFSLKKCTKSVTLDRRKRIPLLLCLGINVPMCSMRF